MLGKFRSIKTDSICLVEREILAQRFKFGSTEIIIFESCRGNIVSIDVFFLSLSLLFFPLYSPSSSIPIVLPSSAQIRITITKRYDHYG